MLRCRGSKYTLMWCLMWCHVKIQRGSPWSQVGLQTIRPTMLYPPDISNRYSALMFIGLPNSRVNQEVKMMFDHEYSLNAG